MNSTENANTEPETLILEKIRKGLTRKQAINAIHLQNEHDEALRAEWLGRRERVIEVLKRFSCTAGAIPFQCRWEIRKTVSEQVDLEEIRAAQKWLAAEANSTK